MKTQLSTLVLSAIAFLAMTQTTLAQSATDLAAIKSVIERETIAWTNRDAQAFVDCWANVPEAGTLVSLQDTAHTIVSNHNTKVDMPVSVKTMLAGMGKPTGETFQNSDYRIRIKGDAAFAQFEQIVTAPDGTKGYAHETRYLEKITGAWKIIHVGAVFYKPAP